ncbi:beta subunit of protein farnesyltransferase [Scheffersomyces amazonensis]|uniref:beta subunit of protein farnesyltransferase n=1 Tax=Scheffersomyces amazonensis TaxID=1078765 RepID=UPI00315C8E71
MTSINEDSSSDNERKVSYILNLLGKKVPTSKENDDNDDKDEDYEDIMTDEDIYTLDSLQQLIASVYNSKSRFNPELNSRDEYTSQTTDTQYETELSILESFKDHPNEQFLQQQHLKYIKGSLHSQFPSYFSALDANHSWMLLWLLNGFKVIKQNDQSLSPETIELINNKIESCIIDEGRGGISGGANQIGHVASTYAAILTLILTKNYTLLEKLRNNLYSWFLSLKKPDGSFVMHKNGESDARSIYCVLAVSSLLNTLTDELLLGLESWLNSCQTFEGGFSGVPKTEAHGGYTYCAVASYFILFSKKSKICFDLDALIRWSVFRQYSIEGGLSGRTNKLVDACYSFWIGALYPMIEVLVGEHDMFNRDGLKTYILKAAQNFDKGGFRDKPGKSTDFYHTNYTLCGLSLCEYKYKSFSDDDSEEELAYRFQLDNDNDNGNDSDYKNTNPINPIFGLPINDINEAKKHFIKLSKPI